MVQEITEILEVIIKNYGILGVFLLMFSNGLFLTPSSDLVMCTSGFLSKLGFLNIWNVLIVGTFGNVLGTGILHFISYIWGEKWIFIISERIDRFLDKTNFRRVYLRISKYIVIRESHLKVLKDYYFARYGVWIVFFFRLVPSLRSIISVPAGIARMSIHTFFIFTMFGCMVWAGLMAWIGWFLGVQKIEIGNYSVLITALIISALILWLNLSFKKRLDSLSERGLLNDSEKSG